MKNLDDFWASGVFDRDYHLPLLNRLDYVLMESGLSRQDLMLRGGCLNDQDLEFITGINDIDAKSPMIGVYDFFSKDIETRMKCMVAIMLRNYRSARYASVHQIVREVEAGDIPDQTLVAIPDLWTGLKGKPPSLTSVHLGYVFEFLLSRNREKPLLMYISDPDHFESNAPASMVDWLNYDKRTKGMN